LLLRVLLIAAHLALQHRDLVLREVGALLIKDTVSAIALLTHDALSATYPSRCRPFQSASAQPCERDFAGPLRRGAPERWKAATGSREPRRPRAGIHGIPPRARRARRGRLSPSFLCVFDCTNRPCSWFFTKNPGKTALGWAPDPLEDRALQLWRLNRHAFY
jgi:hypothetical protein